MTSPIPSPPAIPFLGHVNTIDRDLPLKSIDLLAQQYGEILQLSIFGEKRYIVSSHNLVNEVSDEKRFRKKVSAGLKQVRNAAGDGLFTAFPEEQNWGIAHRLLMPCFGTANIYNMFDDMTDIVSQLVLKWERFGAREMIDPAADFTRLTLDAICLCAMSYRLNSFYREEAHPFATAMADFLIESGRRANRLSLVQAVMTGTNAKYEEDQRILATLVNDILEDHRAHPPAKNDLVQVMLTGRDKETGLGLSPNAWQPFGYGMRGCIGRPFAWQEAQITLVTIMQRFDLVLHDPTYELELKQTLTIKPHNLYIHALPRKDKPRLLATPSTTLISGDSSRERASSGATVAGDAASLHPLYVLYGSNTGSSEAFAQRLASAAASHGFRASLGTLDSATAHLPKDGPVLIVTASFEGQPADNAKHFVEWLENVNDAAFTDIKYAVFGCGNKDWVNTYQRIPTLIDRLLSEHGATRLVERGEGDAAAAEFFGAFDRWEKTVWEQLGAEFGATARADTVGFEVKTVSAGTERAEILRQKDTALGTVAENKILTAPGAPVKRHIEFDLPEGMTYRTGDYLAILPVNPDRVVRRAIVRLGLSAEQEIEINSVGPTSLPVKKPITIYNLLSGYVELQQTATARDLEILLSTTTSPASTRVLQDLSANYAEKVFNKRLSVLDILEENKDIELSLSTFLQVLPSMRIRQYSISSSPLWNAERVSLTLSVVDAPSLSGRAEPFLGVASTYLAGLRPGDKVQLAVRTSNAAFHPPSDLSTPLVMICAGSGLAPMRGFLQERAMQKLAGREVAKSLLFFGCRSPTEDFLYGDSDLKEWSELGIVDIRSAFSRSSADSENCRYVQDRIRHDKELVAKAFDEGAKFYVCGAGKIAAGVKQAIVEYIKEHKPTDETSAVAIFDKIMEGRYATDIFE
ncbi:bifunctional P-450/NADPH-P450 reductase [Polyporus arcularius HHB13444]|uniref:Bifunctional P-450/NADPH-P450 reductase n=1 Tax=Polyporus arcularius HHB13444 TaxID=1314778 RepID=A0A5C3PMI7_9APHY|nr:bifunctional P-450/NADPH-P450 reductase [Polyporus arcularius HHB13444]